MRSGSNSCSYFPENKLNKLVNFVQLIRTCIGGLRGAKGAMPPRCQSCLFCLAYACISAVKLIKFILSVCILGGFRAQKTVCFRGCAPATGFSPRSPPLFSAFGLNFVTPICGLFRIFHNVCDILQSEGFRDA